MDTIRFNVCSLFSFLLPLVCSLYVQVNSNPCLEFACPILESMIVTVIDDTLSLALDPIFRPPAKHRKKTTESATSEGKYQLRTLSADLSHWRRMKKYRHVDSSLLDYCVGDPVIQTFTATCNANWVGRAVSERWSITVKSAFHHTPRVEMGMAGEKEKIVEYICNIWID